VGSEMCIRDRVMMAQQFRLSPWQMDVIRGSLLGDGSLSRPMRPMSRGIKFRLGHGPKQRAYLNWKRSLFANIPGSSWTNAEGASFWDSTLMPELFDLRSEVYRDSRKEFSDPYLESLSLLALAIWYQDDGGFTLRGKRQDRGRIAICVDAMTPATQERVVESLLRRFGLQAKLHHVAGSTGLRLEQPATERFHALIAPYVHPSMEYKLLPQHRGRFAVQPEFTEPVHRLVPAAIADIHRKPPTWNGRRRYRYDLEVEGTHNYLVDGVVVHNSPETTSVGNALMFYASIRLDILPI